MADINLSPYTAEQQAMDRRRKMAEAMQQQAVAPIEMPTVPGAKVSHLQGLAKLLQGYIAGKNLDRADQEQKDYENQVSGETAHLLRNLGQYETVKGEQVSPAVPAETIPAVENQENLDRKNAIVYNFSHRTNEIPSIGMVNNGTRLDENNKNTFMPSSVTGQQIRDANDLPRYTSEEQIKTLAKPATFAADRQIPLLNASFLDPNNPNAYKTGQVRTMLAQYLMQQEAQKQAAAQAEAAASRQIHKFSPEDTAGTIVNGVFKPIVTGTKQPKWEKSSTYDENGREITGWVNTNAPNIPASFVKGAVKPEMTKAQQLDMAIKLYGTKVEAQKAIDEGRVPLTFNPEELNIKPLPTKGTELQIGVMYDTPKGRLRWNGTKFTSVD